MKSKAGDYITNSLKKNRQTITRRLPAILFHPKNKDLHKVRVAIKRIHSIYRLFEFLLPCDFNCTKQYHKISGIFKGLGKIRELKIIGKQIENFQLPEESHKLFLDFVDSEKNKAEKKLKKELKKFTAEAFNNSKKTAHKVSHDLDDEQVMAKEKQFILKEIKEIEKLLQDSANLDKIHKTRKFLKSISYAFSSINYIKSSEKISLLLSQLKEMETCIGKWHDRVAFLQFLHNFKEDGHHAKPGIIAPFNNIATRISRENAKKLNQLKPNLKATVLKLESAGTFSIY